MAAATKKTLAESLAEFQSDLPTVEMDSENPHFRSKFASLPNITKKVLPKLSEHGFSYTVGSFVDNGVLVVDCHLLHVSGESRSLQFPITETNPQKIGSAISYARRYGLTALTGVVADEDDDGNAASAAPDKNIQRAADRTTPPRQQQAASQAKIKAEFLDVEDPTVTRDQVNALTTRIKTETGKKGEDLYAAVYEALKKGEVA